MNELVENGRHDEHGELTPTVREEFLQSNVMQQVKTPYTTAVTVQRPRVLAMAQKRIVEEANLAGEDFYYGWGAGKDRIEGPSVKLALAAVRCYGNCAVNMQPVQETKEAWIFTAEFIDIETGFTLTRQFRQSKKWVVYGKMDEYRKADVRFQIGQSKAIRNVVLNAIPSVLVTRAMEAAKGAVRAKLEAFVEKSGKAAAIDLILRELKKLGVEEKLVLSRFKIANKMGLGIDELVVLRGDISAIQDGEEYASNLFPVDEDPAKKNEDLKAAILQEPAKPANVAQDADRKRDAILRINDMLGDAFGDSQPDISEAVQKGLKIKSLSQLEKWTADQLEKGIADLKAHIDSLPDA